MTVIAAIGICLLLLAAVTPLFVRWRLPVAPLPPPLPVPLLGPSAAPQTLRIEEAILTAATQHWDHEASHKVVFDAKQRHKAAHQRALRLLHQGQLPAPADLKERVKQALTETKGMPRA